MSLEGPLLSVIIPTCRRNDSLAECLNRLAPGVQSYPSGSYEVVVSDDGADELANAMLGSEYPWVKWTKGPCRGPAANRNHGAALAIGTWLVFTDDDCLPETTWLAEYSASLIETISVYEGQTVTDEPSKGPLFTAPVNMNGGLLWSCNFMIRKTVFNGVDGFDESFTEPHLEDVDLRMRLAASGHSVLFVPTARVCHPQRYAPPGPHRVLMYESSVYFARKHGIKLSAAGLSLRVFALQMFRGFSRSISTAAKLRYIVLTLLEWTVLLPPLLFWIVKYYHVVSRGDPRRPALRSQT